MKKLIMTLAIVLGLGLASFAQGGGLFMRGEDPESSTKSDGAPMLPGSHGTTGNSDADAPVGTGLAVLTVLGAAYLVGKKRREE